MDKQTSYFALHTVDTFNLITRRGLKFPRNGERHMTVQKVSLYEPQLPTLGSGHRINIGLVRPELRSLRKFFKVLYFSRPVLLLYLITTSRSRNAYLDR